MGIITEMLDGISHLKALLYGKQGSGKTFTAVELACGVHQTFDCKKPVLCIDTETGMRFHRPKIQQRTGMAPLGVNTRRLPEVLDAMKEASDMGIEVVVIDSVTHLWNGLKTSYIRGLAERFKVRPEEVHLNVGDIGNIKEMWQPFADWFVSVPMHVVICGRLGYDWDMVENDRGKSELTKTGTKAKAEGEFGYEADLLIEMEYIQDDHPEFGRAAKAGLVPQDATSAVRATIVKERWDIQNGARCWNPTVEFIRPVLKQLRPREHAPIDTDAGVQDLSDEGRRRWQYEKDVALESIEQSLVHALPGHSGRDKTHKLDITLALFRTRSWTEIKNRELPSLKRCAKVLADVCARIREDREIVKKIIPELEAAALDIFGPVPSQDDDPLDTERQLEEALAGSGSTEHKPDDDTGQADDDIQF